METEILMSQGAQANGWQIACAVLMVVLVAVTVPVVLWLSICRRAALDAAKKARATAEEATERRHRELLEGLALATRALVAYSESVRPHVIAVRQPTTDPAPPPIHEKVPGPMSGKRDTIPSSREVASDESIFR